MREFSSKTTTTKNCIRKLRSEFFFLRNKSGSRVSSTCGSNFSMRVLKAFVSDFIFYSSYMTCYTS